MYSGYLAMGGQIVDATIVAAPKQRNTHAEKADIKAGKVPDAWKDKPAKLRQKCQSARKLGSDAVLVVPRFIVRRSLAPAVGRSSRGHTSDA